MKKALLVVAFIAFAILSYVLYTNPATAPARAPTSTEPTSLAPSDATYAMVLFNDGTGMRDVIDKNFTLRLVENTINGKICNSFNGAYALSTDAILTAPQVVSTKMMCEPNIMAVENALFASLATGLDMRTDGQDITLTSGANVFVFKPLAGASTE